VTASEALPTGGAGTIGSGTKTRPVRCWLPESPPHLDPHGGVDESSMRLHAAMFEGLFRPGPDGEAVPALAETVRVSRDGLTVDITLRREAYWSDGVPVTAQHFQVCVERALEPGTPLRAAWQMYPIRGARERHRGEAGPELGLELRSDRELRLSLAEPMPRLGELLMLPALAPLRPDRLPPLTSALTAEGATAADAAALTDWWLSAPVSGPYRPARLSAGDHYGYLRNESHWDAERMPPHPLEFRIGGDPLDRYARGEVDLAWVDAQRLAERGSADTTVVTEGTTVFAVVNCGRAEFADQRIRDALAYSLDRERWVAESRSLALPLTRLVPRTPGSAGYLSAYPLAAPGGSPQPLLRGSTLTLSCGNSADRLREATALADQLAQGTGATVELRPLPSFDLYWSVKRGDYQLALLAWRADFDDPLACLREHVSNGAAGNQSKWSDPAYDELIARARRTPEGAKRSPLLAEAERRVLDHHAVLPLGQHRKAWLIRPGLSGMVFRATGTAVDSRWARW
jgi:oligopeptide transport system substrate-binding protein